MDSTTGESLPRSRLLVVLTAAVVVLSVAIAILAVQVVRIDRRNRDTRCELRLTVAAVAGRGSSTPEELADILGRGCEEHEIFDL